MNTTLKGNDFEVKCFDLISKAVNAGELGLIPSMCKVYLKKGYYSHLRKRKIIFDLSIEVWPEGAENYTLLYLLECKDYSKKVPVDDLEEFESKVRQVTGINGKGVFITTNDFQKNGCYDFAKSVGMMLIKVNNADKTTIILHNAGRKQSTESHETESINSELNKLEKLGKYITFTEKEQENNIDNEIKAFLNKVLNDDEHEITENQIADYGIERLSSKLIEDIAIKILNNYNPAILSNYQSLPITNFISYLKEKYNITTILDQELSPVNNRKVYAFFDSSNNSIYVDKSLIGHETFNFKFIHEVAHFFLHAQITLGQENYENLEDSIFNPTINKYELLNERNWLEWQANQLAASILIPENSLLYKLIEYQVNNYIRNKGTIYVDHQKQNRLDYLIILEMLTTYFGVSKAVMEIRLLDLGILKYRKKSDLYAYPLEKNFNQPSSISSILRRHPLFKKSHQ